jgi:hypothetical protein
MKKTIIDLILGAAALFVIAFVVVACANRPPGKPAPAHVNSVIGITANGNPVEFVFLVSDGTRMVWDADDCVLDTVCFEALQALHDAGKMDAVNIVMTDKGI